MDSMRQFLVRLWTDESGISSVEYVLLLALVGSAIILGATFLGQEVGNQLDETAQCIADGTTCTPG